MPKLISYTPAWLSRPSPGFDLFTKSSDGRSSISPKRHQADGAHGTDMPLPEPCRFLAHRGPEVFAVAGDNTIRWADLSVLKDNWDSHNFQRSRIRSPPSEDADSDAPQYKVLKVAVHEKIRQLAISPNHTFLAIATSHTVHVAILPESSRLTSQDSTPIKLKTFTVGPTVHVLSQARVVSLLWHPLGVNGDCLVTVTGDAVVRLWELNQGNRWSFDSAALALDLRKLYYATSAEDDLRAEGLGDNRGYSLDGLGMEASAAAFGGRGSDEESGWSATTLFVAMSEGDVYALCPLLPAKWQPPRSLLPTLSTAVAAKRAYLDNTSAPFEKAAAIEDQFTWLRELDDEEPMMVADSDNLAKAVAIYSRPKCLSSVPKLQGPFRIMPGDMEDMMDIADIHIVAPKLDAEELLDEEELFDIDTSNGLPMPIINLLTSGGIVYSCLSLEPVEAQWLPIRKTRPKTQRSARVPLEMFVLSAQATVPSHAGECTVLDSPMFTPDVHCRHAFFVTHRRSIHFFSLQYWIDHVAPELDLQNPDGKSFRLSVLFEHPEIICERIFRFEQPRIPHAPQTPGSSRSSEPPEATSSYRPVSAPVVLQDSDLGYFLLTSTPDKPYAALFDAPFAPRGPTDAPLLLLGRDGAADSPASSPPHPALAPRLAYQPPAVLDRDPGALLALDPAPALRRLPRATQRAELRLSSATLEALTHLHRDLSARREALSAAVAELFTRCRRLPAEFAEQRRQVAELDAKIAQVTGREARESESEGGSAGGDREETADEDEEGIADEDEERSVAEQLAVQKEPREAGPANLLERLRRVDQKQEELKRRQEELRRKLAQVCVQPLNDQEQAWAEEVGKLKPQIPMDDADEEQAMENGDEDEDETAESGDADEGETAEADSDGAERESSQTGKDYRQRFSEAKDLARKLLDEARAIKQEDPEPRPSTARSGRPPSSHSSSIRVPAEVRKRRVDKVMDLLRQEAELVDAAQERLQRLTLAPTAAG